MWVVMESRTLKTKVKSSDMLIKDKAKVKHMYHPKVTTKDGKMCPWGLPHWMWMVMVGWEPSEK